MARYTALRADERAGELTPQLRRRALREAGRLAGMGWRAQELDARLVAARVALALGDVGTVRRELRQAAAARTRGSTELRIRAWYAEALVRLATGREAAAERALRAGFRVMEQQRATLGATELRVHVASHAHDVASLGIQIAVRGGSPRKVLDWAERWRAGALGLRPVRPPADEELAAALAELRRVSAEAENALLNSRPVDRLLARRRTLEERVRRLARQAAGPLFAPPAEPPTVDQLSAGLGDAVLIELIATVEDDALTAVTLRDGEPRLHALGSRDGRSPGAGRAAVRAAPARARARCAAAGAGAGRAPGEPAGGRGARPAPGRAGRPTDRGGADRLAAIGAVGAAAGLCRPSGHGGAVGVRMAAGGRYAATPGGRSPRRAGLRTRPGGSEGGDRRPGRRRTRTLCGWRAPRPPWSGCRRLWTGPASRT